MRTFIAIDLPEDVKASIAACVRRLKPLVSGGVSWARVDDIHLTLKFLGEIEASSLPAVEQALVSAARETDIFTLGVRGTGTFPGGTKRPRVLWVGLTESQALQRFQDRIETALEGAGFSREEKPFRPHLTLARVRTASVPSSLIRRLSESESAPFGDLVVREAVVYSSRLLPQGPQHEALFKAALRT